MCDHTPRGDEGAASDGDTRQNDDASADEGAAGDQDRCRSGWELGLQRMVSISDIGVGEDQDPLRQGHVVLEANGLGKVQEALVSKETVIPDGEARQTSPIEVEEPNIVEDDSRTDPGSEEPEPGCPEGRKERKAIGDHGRGEETEASGSGPADLLKGFHDDWALRTRLKARSFLK